MPTFKYPYGVAYPICHLGANGEIDSKYLAWWTSNQHPGSMSIRDLLSNYHGYLRGAGNGLRGKRNHLMKLQFTAGGFPAIINLNLAAGGYIDSFQLSFNGGATYVEMLNRIDNSYWRGLQNNLKWLQDGGQHAPRQAGASFSRDGGTYAVTPRYVHGSPIIRQDRGPHHLSIAEYAYVECVPLEFDPNGTNPETEASPSANHNGNKYEPVIYPDLRLGMEIIPQFKSLGDLGNNVIRLRNKAYFPSRAEGLTSVAFRTSRLFLQDIFTTFYIWTENAGLSTSLAGRALNGNTYLDSNLLYSMDTSQVTRDIDGTPTSYPGVTDIAATSSAGLVLEDPARPLTIGLYCSNFSSIRWRKRTGTAGVDGTAAAETWMHKTISIVVSAGYQNVDTYLVIHTTPAGVAAIMASLAAANL